MRDKSYKLIDKFVECFRLKKKKKNRLEQPTIKM